MTNVEIYDTSNSELSSDEYSQEEDDEGLMDAAVSKQAGAGKSLVKAGAGTSAGAQIMPKPTENPDDEGPVAAAAVDAAEKDKISDKIPAPAVVQEPPSTIAETHRQIMALMARRPYKLNVYYKRRSLLWLKQKDERTESYKIRLQRKMAILRRRRYSSDSRSLSYSRSNSPSMSRSRSPSRSRSFDRSRSYDRSRSGGSQSPELICLDDTENEDSPEKPEEAKAADVTPRKENKTKTILPSPPAQPQFEQQQQQQNDKSNENGTSSSVLEEFLMIKESKQPPSQAGIELDKLTASLELEEAMAETTLVQQEEQVAEEEPEPEPMAMDATLKRRRSVTPPLSNDKRPKPAEAFGDVDEDDDTIEFLPVAAQNSGEATPLIKEQPPKANPIQSQPAFKLSTPYTLALSPAVNAKQALSHSLNTPTPPAVPMEISYPTDNHLPPIAKSNIVIAPPPEQPASAYGSPLYAAPAQAAPVKVGTPRSFPTESIPPRASEAVQGPHALGLGPPRALQPPRATAPLQTASPRATGPLQAGPSRPQPAAPARQQPPALVIQEPPPVPVNATSFVVPQQPQPRRSETVSTQTQVDQPEAPPPSTGRPKSAAPDLKNSDANFHYRLKELFPEIDSILRERADVAGPDTTALIEKIDIEVRSLDKMLAQKEDEWNRLIHLRCAKMELRERLERRERVSVIKKLLPSVITKNCSTAELIELQEEQIAPMAARRSGPTTNEHYLKQVEHQLKTVQLQENELQRLQRVMDVKIRQKEEVQKREAYRRNSLPAAQQASMREHLDVAEERASKRAKLERTYGRLAQELTDLSPNLAATSSSTSSSHNNLLAPGKPPYYSHTSSLDNHLENESQIKPLYNSSPMVSQRNLSQRQYADLHSTSYRNEEEMPEVSGSKDTKKSLLGKAPPSTANGKKNQVCHHCQRYEAIYKCTGCKNQSYCSIECQHRDWESHSIVCGK